MVSRFSALLALLVLTVTLSTKAADPPADLALFNLEDPAGLKDWSNLAPPDVKDKEPSAKLDQSEEHAAAGKHSWKITFAGGNWPTLSTTHVPADWAPYENLKAEVVASRPCLIGFTVLQEGSKRDGSWEALVSRWTKTQLLKPGKNQITASLHANEGSPLRPRLENGKEMGKIVRFEIFMYRPHEGESIHITDLRLSAAKETAPAPVRPKFRVAGTDMEVADVQELGQKLRARWYPPANRTVAEVEAAFTAQFAELKRKNPKAVIAILRDGEKGYDPAHPDTTYSGWKEAYFTSHGPDSNTIDRAHNGSEGGSHEIFMRHRSPMMRVDMASIPKDAEILTAQLVVVRSNPTPLKEQDLYKQATMWAVEPCNRPWEEKEVNAYEYAHDHFWQQIGGRSYGDDPDFLPTFLAYGPGQGIVNAWDFTDAVRFWADGKHVNHGFMLHNDGKDYMTAFTHRASELKDRPAVLVVYVPKG